MGKRLCEEAALVAAVLKSGFDHLFGSALLRFGRGEKLFAIVGNERGLQAAIYDVESIKPDHIVLTRLKTVQDEAIAKWFRKVEERKRNREWSELDEHDLRYLASQAFPGSFFYDIFINQGDHIFAALPPLEDVPSEDDGAAETAQTESPFLASATA